MKFIPENFVSYDEIATSNDLGVTINVQFCRSCPFFQPNGIQPEKSITRGWCARLSDEELPHYIRVTSNDFCNEDAIKNDLV